MASGPISAPSAEAMIATMSASPYTMRLTWPAVAPMVRSRANARCRCPTAKANVEETTKMAMNAANAAAMPAIVLALLRACSSASRDGSSSARSWPVSTLTLLETAGVRPAVSDAVAVPRAARTSPVGRHRASASIRGDSSAARGSVKNTLCCGTAEASPTTRYVWAPVAVTTWTRWPTWAPPVTTISSSAAGALPEDNRCGAVRAADQGRPTAGGPPASCAGKTRSTTAPGRRSASSGAIPCGSASGALLSPSRFFTLRRSSGATTTGAAAYRCGAWPGEEMLEAST